MASFPVIKCYYIAKVSLLFVLVLTVLGLYEKWRGGQRAASATDLSEQEYEREIQEDEARIIPGLGEGGAAAYLTGEEQKLGENSEKKLALNVYLSDRVAYNRTLQDERNPACAQVTYDAELPSVTVILICHNEPYSFVIRTIWSVINSCRRENPWFQRANYIDRYGRTMKLGYPGQDESSPFVYLKEIILVRDNSTLPELKGKLSYYVRTRLPPDLVRILPLTDCEGVTSARTAAARDATSSVLVFLASDSEVQTDWLRPLLQTLKDRPNSVVMPIIDYIDRSNLFYSTQPNSQFQVGGFTFAGNFKWIDVSPEEKKRRGSEISPTWSPTMTGGLFAINGAYFWELGAYDEQMVGWGGEKLEMSFRIWQCGGTLETIPCSRVGHVYRSFDPYIIPANSDTYGINTARMAEVWMDEYAELFYLHRPDLRNNPKIGDVTHRKVLREKLRCKNFQWFLDNIYKEKFVPVRDDYRYGRFRNIATNRCIDSMQLEGAEHPLGVYQCHPSLQTTQYFSLSHAHQLRDEESCAQIQFNRSGVSARQGRTVVMSSCHGRRDQEWQLLKDTKQLQHTQSQLCLEVSAELEARPCSDAPAQRWDIDYSEDNHFHKPNEVVPSDLDLKLRRLRGKGLKSLVSHNLDERRHQHQTHHSRSTQIQTKNKFILKLIRTLMNYTEEHLEMDIYCKHHQLYPNNTFVRDLVTILNERNIKVINNGRVFERNKVTLLDPKQDEDRKFLNVQDIAQKNLNKKRKRNRTSNPVVTRGDQRVGEMERGDQLAARRVDKLIKEAAAKTSGKIIERDSLQATDTDSDTDVWNVDLGRKFDTFETARDIGHSTREPETEHHSPDVINTKHRKYISAIAVQRHGGGTTSERSAPPIVESVNDTAEAFAYCAERAGHYARKRDGDSVSYIDAAKEFTYCANVAHSVKVLAKDCTLSVACSNTTASTEKTEIDVVTGSNKKYIFYSVLSDSVQFKVKAANDANIALSAVPNATIPLIEVVIGGDYNRKTMIRRNEFMPELIELNTIGILNGSEYRGFWVRWDRGNISVGRDAEAMSFITCKNPEPFPVKYVGFTTGWQATGSWKIKGISRMKAEDMGRRHDGLSTLKPETELQSLEVAITKRRKFKWPLAVERRGAISLRAASALPPVVQTVANAAQAFTYCAARAEHYASERDVKKASAGAAMDFANCANVANTLKATVKNCDLSTACSNTTDGLTERLPITMPTKASLTTMSLPTTTTSGTTTLLTTTIPEKTWYCEGSGYKYIKVTDQCYKLHNESKVLWGDANRTCVAEGAHLAVFSSEEEKEMLENLVKTTGLDCFIGVYKDTEHIWRTVTGEDHVNGTWPSVPDEADQDFYAYGYLDTTGTYGDAYSDDRNIFICEWKLPVTRTHTYNYS